MKTRVLRTVTLTLLLLSGPLWSMEATPAANTVVQTRRSVNPGADISSVVRMLSHYSPAQAVKVIKAMVPDDDVEAGWSAADNSVIVRASRARCQQIEDVLALLDRPEPPAPADSTGGDNIRVFRLSHCPAAMAAKTIMTAFEGKVVAAADERANSVVVTAAPTYGPLIENLLLIVDSPVSASPSAVPTMEVAAESRRTAATDPTARAGGPAPDRTLPTSFADAEPVTRIYVLHYSDADRTVGILYDLLRQRRDITLVPDPAGNQILVAASPKSQDLVKELIQELDMPPVDQPRNAQMMCRVFMLELPPTGVNLKEFLIKLKGTEPAPAETIVEAIQNPNVQIQDISQQYAGSETYELSIVGRAPSREDVTALVAAFPNAQIQAFSWEEGTFAAVRAPQYRPSEPLREHLSKLLGDNLQTVGYWFGDMSLPGEVRAPIGPWSLNLSMEPEPGDELTFLIDVEQTQMEGPRGGRSQSTILSNSGRGKIGKPIIIGYNRDRDGTRTMGALVIIPEPANPDL